MRHLDLFSGIGGFALAASWVWGAEHEIVSFCEIDPYCQAVLKKHWPDAPVTSDIRELNGSDYANIDLLTAGFPCQPFSVAGKKLRQDDPRNLWPATHDSICSVRPRIAFMENVPAILNGYAGTVFGDLAESGYGAEWDCIPANVYGGHFVGERLWIIAAPSAPCGLRWERVWTGSVGENQWGRDEFERLVQLEVQNGVPAGKNNRISDGIPFRVDRLKSLGNAIVPQVAAAIMQEIKTVDERTE